MPASPTSASVTDAPARIPSSPLTRRTPWAALGIASLLLGTVVALVAGLAYGGGAAAPAFTDPGAVVRWGLPVGKALVNLGAAGAIGAILLAVIALSIQSEAYSREIGRAHV